MQSNNPIRRANGLFSIINKNEEGLRLFLGKFKPGDLKSPGFHIILPFFHSMYRVDRRERVTKISKQSLISRDNVTFFVDGCVQWGIADAEKAFFNVDQVHESILEVAKIEMRNLLSSLEINEILHRRGDISKTILENIKYVEDRWGVAVTRVEIMDINFDESMTRAMAVKAEADRNAEAKIINAEADVQTAKKYKEASEIYMDNPVSLRLREYQLWQSVSHNPATTMFIVPSNVVDFIHPMMHSLSGAASGKEEQGASSGKGKGEEELIPRRIPPVAGPSSAENHLSGKVPPKWGQGSPSSLSGAASEKGELSSSKHIPEARPSSYDIYRTPGGCQGR
jgi:hypothetical protein